MSNNIQVLVVPVDSKPYFKIIPNELKPLQDIVGGYIELVKTKEGYNIFCNEEGKLMDLEPNIFINMRNDYIAGTFFVCFDDEEGEMIDILKEDAENFLYKYVIGNKVNPNYNMLNWKL